MRMINANPASREWPPEIESGRIQDLELTEEQRSTSRPTNDRRPATDHATSK